MSGIDKLDFERLMARLERVEQKLDLLLQNAGIASPGEDEDAAIAEVRALLRAGRKIEAIKRYREVTGVGLKDAKDAVEAME